MKADTPAFEAAVKRAVHPLRDDPRVAGITTAYDGGAVSSEAAAGPKNGPEPPEERLISRDGRRTLVVVEFEKRPESELVDEVYPRLREKVSQGPLEVTNLLSISASFGALVWVFQEGHLAGLLGFSPVDTDPALLVIVFCVVFGLSMDYEVLLLNRIKEQYEKTRDNAASVTLGLEKTGRLVTGAALIMASVFYSFGLADTVLIKSLGLTMGLAVIVDATVVRALLVPATMRLLGHLNWWTPAAPARLDRSGR